MLANVKTQAVHPLIINVCKSTLQLRIPLVFFFSVRNPKKKSLFSFKHVFLTDKNSICDKNMRINRHDISVMLKVRRFSLLGIDKIDSLTHFTTLTMTFVKNKRKTALKYNKNSFADKTQKPF